MHRNSLFVCCAALAATSLPSPPADAELLGIQPGFPQLFFDSTGVTGYDADFELFLVGATPVAIRFAAGDPPVFIQPAVDPPARTVSIAIAVANDGSLVGGVLGNDLQIVGAIDEDGDGEPDYEGVLLTGEIQLFGFQDGGPNASVDFYDFSFAVTGGSLAPLFDGLDAGVALTSEESDFTGDFTLNFSGEAKGVLGGLGGACCFPDGSCEELTQDECAIAEGLFQGLGSTCDIVECPEPTGACCVDGDCGVTTQDQCAELEGLYQGDGIACADVECPTPPGACCFEDGGCAVMPLADCLEQEGFFQGEGTNCDDAECSSPEQACCLNTGACAVVDPATCLRFGGLPQGPGTDCFPNECLDPVGACCLPDRGCAELTQAQCQRGGGDYQGDGTTCDRDPCP